ncbi:MAG: hypothetical protein M3Y18_03900 [Candidatus Eremiobacteraeota bacterium]|nr:hypothetical protein [Candidatus Eremiobacteraeota bacterium]
MFLSLVHLRDMTCSMCGELLAQGGARSFIVDATGIAVGFAEADPPAEMVVEITCEQGHGSELNVPNEISAEQTLQTPEEAPTGRDAVLLSGTTEADRSL